MSEAPDNPENPSSSSEQSQTRSEPLPPLHPRYEAPAEPNPPADPPATSQDGFRVQLPTDAWETNADMPPASPGTPTSQYNSPPANAPAYAQPATQASPAGGAYPAAVEAQPYYSEGYAPNPSATQTNNPYPYQPVPEQPTPFGTPPAAWAGSGGVRPPVRAQSTGSGGPRYGFVILSSVMAAVLGAAIAIGAVFAGGGFQQASSTSTRVIPAPKTPTDVRKSEFNNVNVIKIADEVRPAIVNIQTQSSLGQGGTGSGVIYDASGLILTNNHVVTLGGNAPIGASTKLKVQLTDGRSLDGKVLGTDAAADIAVVKVDATDLPAAPLGTAKTLRIGEPVVAIGNPLGLQGGPTVSTGVISALGRTLQASQDSSLYDMIQTDASISPGSSGGALVDAQGNVIGITTAKAPTEVNAEGIGFATPIDIARKGAEQIVANGKVQRPYLGIRGGDTQTDGANAKKGAKITSVDPGTPAANAGLKEGDVITAVDGDPVTSFAGLIVAMRSHNVGDNVKLTYTRDGKDAVADIKLAQQPEQTNR